MLWKYKGITSKAQARQENIADHGTNGPRNFFGPPERKEEERKKQQGGKKGGEEKERMREGEKKKEKKGKIWKKM